MKSVSIVLCTYNGEKYLAEQLNSILAQTYPLKEIVVQDDGSTDSTLEILQRYSIDHPGLFRIYHSPVGGNINRNFFTCASRAEGDFIVFSDQDDLWHKEKVATLIDRIGTDNICFHSPYHFYEDPPSFESLPKVDIIPNYGLPRQLFAGSVPGHTMMVKKQFLNYVVANVPDTELFNAPFYYDTILADIALITGSVSFVPAYLTLHRCHSSSKTAGGSPKTYFSRNLSNFVLQLLQGCDPQLRKKVKPVFDRRFKAAKSLINHFPNSDASAKVTKLIDSYFSPLHFIKFPIELIKNKDYIFYKKETNKIVAVFRAILFPITMFNYYK